MGFKPSTLATGVPPPAHRAGLGMSWATSLRNAPACSGEAREPFLSSLQGGGLRKQEKEGVGPGREGAWGSRAHPTDSRARPPHPGLTPDPHEAPTQRPRPPTEGTLPEALSLQECLCRETRRQEGELTPPRAVFFSRGHITHHTTQELCMPGAGGSLRGSSELLGSGLRSADNLRSRSESLTCPRESQRKRGPGSFQMRL